MGLTIGFTYNQKETAKISADQPSDINAEFDSEETLSDIIGALESGGHTVLRIGDVQELLSRLPHLGVDVVFNIAEGQGSRNRESQVPMLLELFGIPYIGSDALTMGITLDKLAAKKCFIADGILTPRYFQAFSTENLNELNRIGFPLIVKPCFEGTSKGISALSRVEDEKGLLRQVALITEKYRQPALVEEFISGREFTVVVFGNENPEAMPPVQYSIDRKLDLGDAFYTAEHVVKGSVDYLCPAKISDDLSRRIKDAAVKVYKSVGCRDFGRADFRVDENEKIYALEINPMPNLSKKDTFFYVAAATGKDYKEMVLRALDEGLARLGMSQEAGAKR